MSSRRISDALIFINVLLLIYISRNEPGPIISKYDFQGQPIQYFSTQVFVLFISSVLAMTNLLMWGLSVWLRKSENFRFVNIPYKSYWERPENKTEGLRRVGHLLTWTTIFTNSVCLAVILMCSNRVVGTGANLVVGTILLSSIAFIVFLVRYFKPQGAK